VEDALGLLVAGRRAARALALAAHGLRVAEAMGWGRGWLVALLGSLPWRSSTQAKDGFRVAAGLCRTGRAEEGGGKKGE